MSEKIDFFFIILYKWIFAEDTVIEKIEGN